MNIAIAGATGVVGRKIIEILEERRFVADNFYFFASKNSFGKTLKIYGKNISVEELNDFNVKSKKIDIAFLACPSTVSIYYAPLFAKIGATVIDNSSAFRLNKNVPLVVPTVNDEEIFTLAKRVQNRTGRKKTGTTGLNEAVKTGYDDLGKTGCNDIGKTEHNDIGKTGRGIISNPNCSTIMLMPVLNALKKFGLKKINVTTYQAVSGAGRQGVLDLSGGEKQNLKFDKRIYSNCLSKIGKFDENGYSEEENKIINESKKILRLPRLKVSATAVRVPVFNCHSEAVYAEFSSVIDLKSVISKLSIAPRVKLYLDDYPTVLDADGNDFIHVGRVRKDISNPRGLQLWITSDNLRTGAALNAVLIAEILQKTPIIDI